MSIKYFPKIVTKQFTISAVLIVVLPLKLILQGAVDNGCLSEFFRSYCPFA